MSEVPWQWIVDSAPGVVKQVEAPQGEETNTYPEHMMTR